MTEHTETVEIDSKEMFESAMAPEPKQEEQSERARDDKGRFVAAAKEEAQPEAKQPEVAAEQPKTEAAPQVPTEQPQDKEEAQVPSWRLREIREQREAAERRADEVARENYAVRAEMQAMREQLARLNAPKQEPVDFFADPDKAINQHLNPLEQRLGQFMQDMTLRLSRNSAIVQHGAERVAEMESAIEKLIAARHPDMAALSAQMRASDDPAGVAMNWYQRHRLVEETGGDISAYKAKLQEELLNDPKFQAKIIERAKGQAPSGTVVQLPPSLNRTPSSGQSHTAEDSDASDRAMFNYALRGK